MRERGGPGVNICAECSHLEKYTPLKMTPGKFGRKSALQLERHSNLQMVQLAKMITITNGSCTIYQENQEDISVYQY